MRILSSMWMWRCEKKGPKHAGSAPYSSPVVRFPYSRLGVVPQAMPEMMIFWMLDVPSTTCSDFASR